MCQNIYRYTVCTKIYHFSRFYRERKKMISKYTKKEELQEREENEREVTVASTI